jgi:pyruvate kinase
MKTKIIATIGPNSLNQKVLKAFKERNVDLIRVNLSHTKEELIESTIVEMKKSGIEVAIDTEGSQVRTGYLGQDSVTLIEGTKIKVYDFPVPCNKKTLYLRPKEALASVEVGSLISIDFNSVLLKVIKTDTLSDLHYVQCVVLSGGVVGNNKAVTIDSTLYLPPFSQKDLVAIELAKKHKISVFTLSFMDSADEVKMFRKLYPKATLISKIETKKGVQNFHEILKVSDGILIDRGDLSREVAQEKIPFAQKIIIRAANKAKKPVLVATNVLESMSENLKPMKSEINDVINTILDGVNGLVLTKESAVGKHPIETVNTLRSIVDHVEAVLLAASSKKGNYLDEISYITDPRFEKNLIEPHGGNLINRYQKLQFTDKELSLMKSLKIDEEILMDLEQLAFGVYSPLEGFMNEDELNSVLDKMRLLNGLPWTMPIILPVTESQAKKLKPKETITLVRDKDKKIYGTMHLESIYKVDQSTVCQKWFGTTNQDHPGVKRIMQMGNYYLGGKIDLLHRRPSPSKDYELTPAQTRKIFQEKGWSVIVGFHTRNPIHRSHEFIQLQAMEKIQADGLFVHPVVGKKKKGDFEAEIIIKAYELMMRKFYPSGKVVMGVYATYSRYAGPREAVFTALCRKNYGCSHFIIGRDHTGVGDFYHPMASQEIFSKFPDLGIKTVMFGKISYSKTQQSHLSESETPIPEEDRVQISGTQIRQMFMNGDKPPEWFMRPEIAKMISDHIKNGKKVFVA